MRETCPHCQACAIVRTSENMSRLVKRLYCRCTNEACGFAFVVHAEIICTLSPAAAPNPNVLLPMSHAIQREALIEQMLHAPQPPGAPARAPAHDSTAPDFTPEPECDSAAAEPAPEPPSPVTVSAFRRTRRLSSIQRADLARAASLPKNTWHPAPGFVLPAHIGHHLPAEHFKLI